MQRPSPRFRSEEFFVYEISEEMFYPNSRGGTPANFGLGCAAKVREP